MINANPTALLSLSIVPAILLAAACNHNVYTPPARAFGITSPQVLEDGETAVRANVSSSSQLFGPEIIAGSAGVRRGTANNVELVGDLSYAKVNEASAADSNRSIAMGRIGGKVHPTESRNLAITAGIGGGYAPAAGMYASADLGVVVGYENRYVIPFASAGAYTSVPIDPKEVNTTQPGDSEQRLDTPEKTLGLTIGAGLKIPLDSSALLLGMTWVQVHDNDSHDEFMTIGAGVETTF
jgi:hypothetical protein